MADKNSGWLCNATASVVAQTDTTATIEVACYWKNNGWRYDINFVSAWVYKDGTAQQVMNSGSVDSTAGYQASVKLGSYKFTVNKTTSTQSIPCCAKITSNSSYVSGTKWSGDIYVAVAAKPSYTVSYNANGGSGAPAAQTKWYGTNLTLSSSKPSRTGYTFQGWSTSASGSVAYAAGATYSANAVLTLYAVWKANTYTVSYNANGGSGAPGAQTKTYGVNLTLSSTKPTRTNYNFLGWSTSASGSVVYASGATYTANSAVTLYAVWELAYQKPRITNFSAYRSDSAGNASETGTYIKVAFNWATDYTVSAVKVQWKKQSIDWQTETVSASGTSDTASINMGTNFSTENSWQIRAYVSDSGGTTYSQEISIGTVKFPIDVKVGGTGVAIGKVSEKDAFEVAMDMYDKNGGPIISDRLTKTITITGDANTYYPVKISLSPNKDKPQTVSVWKNLGSPTASYPGNHSNGTSSLWLIYECRRNSWDGNGGYIKTKYKFEGYATLVAHVSLTGQAAGDLVVWLRGGGTEYNITCDNTFDIIAYYSDTNLGSSSYPTNVGPVTDIGNGGIQSSTYIGYGNITGNANYATSAGTASTATNANYATSAGYAQKKVGEVIITATNTNPNNMGYSGTWQLIDREFQSSDGLTGYTSNTANVSSYDIDISRSSDTLFLSGGWTAGVQWNDDDVHVGTVDLAACGVSRLAADVYFVAYTDAGNSGLMCELEFDTGKIIVHDNFGDQYISAGRYVKWSCAIPIPSGYMLDSACNRFYWKRTA